MNTPALSLTLISALVLNTCALPAAESNAKAPVRSCCAKAVTTAATYTDKSLYQVESAWTTDNGQPFKLGDLAGKPQVILMFFSKCTSACPILLNELKNISAALTPEQRARAGFTMVSFDTETDTPTALAAYRKAWEVPDKNWTLLSGRPDDVRELAALLGIEYRKLAPGRFAHSNVITVLNAQGEIVHQRIGLDENLDKTVQALVKLLGN